MSTRPDQPCDESPTYLLPGDLPGTISCCAVQSLGKDRLSGSLQRGVVCPDRGCH